MTDTRATRAAGDLGYPDAAWIRDTVTTANGERLIIPTGWYGMYIQITVVGSATVYIRIGGDSVQVDPTTVSSVGSEAVTAGGKEPHIIVSAGIDAPVRIARTGQTRLAHIASATGSKLYIRLATGDGT